MEQREKENEVQIEKSDRRRLCRISACKLPIIENP